MEEQNKDESVELSRVDEDNVGLDDLFLIKPEEIRENYNKARNTLNDNLELGGRVLKDLCDNLSTKNDDVIPDIDSPELVVIDPKIYGNVSMLIKALNETARTLATIHQEAGTNLGNVKSVNIDNSKKVIAASSNDMLMLAKELKK